MDSASADSPRGAGAEAASPHTLPGEQAVTASRDARWEAGDPVSPRTRAEEEEGPVLSGGWTVLGAQSGPGLWGRAALSVPRSVAGSSHPGLLLFFCSGNTINLLTK